MRSVLIAGCGYVGQAAADLFHKAGWAVEGWTRTARDIVRPYPVVSVDICDAGQVRARAREFDAVIHSASTRGGDAERYRQVYLNGAKNLIAAFPKTKIVFTSSTSVYAQTGGEWVTERSGTVPARESSQILMEAEKAILGNNGIVGRLGGIYGPNRSALLDKFLRGEVVVEQDYYVNQVHREDIASALFLLLDQNVAGGEIYNVTDGNPVLVSECYRWLAEKLGRRDTPKTSAGGRRRGNTNKRVDNAKLRRTGWELRYPTFAKGMTESVFPSRGLSAT